jgi:hypothetical protein
MIQEDDSEMNSRETDQKGRRRLKLALAVLCMFLRIRYDGDVGRIA